MARNAEAESVGVGRISKIGPWWHVRWTDESGERHREALKVTTKNAARTKAAELSRTIETGSWIPRRERKALRFVDMAEEFVKHVEDSAKRTGGVTYTLETAKGYQSHLRRLAGNAMNRKTGKPIPAAPFSDSYVGSISPDQIEEYLNNRQDRDGVSLATRNRILAFIKSVFSWAVEERGLLRNPTERVKIVANEELDPRRRETRALSVEETEHLLRSLGEKGGLLYDVVLCAADTGLRAGSLKAMCWKHVDWKEKLIRLPTSKGKTALEVTLSERLQEHLRSMYERARSRSINGTVVLTTNVQELPVFPNKHDATKPFNNIWKGLSKAATQAGVGHTHLHVLRHSFCTQSANAGAPSPVLKEQMGHKRLTTTERYYHPDRERSTPRYRDVGGGTP
jgi:integrase